MICANCKKEFKGKIFIDSIEKEHWNLITDRNIIESDFCEHCGVFQVVKE